MSVSVVLLILMSAKLALVLALIAQWVTANNISMTMTSSQLQVGALANSTILLNRTRDVNGASITPSVIPSTVLITISFDESYTVLANTTLATYSQYTVNASTRSITLTYNTALYSSQTISIQVLSYTNPKVSGVGLPVFAKITNPDGTLYDEAQTSLSFTQVILSNTNDIGWQFSPTNVSTISNLSISLSNLQQVWTAAMYVQISLKRYWTRSVSNTTSTVIFSVSSTCTPTCTINRLTQSTLVTFTSLEFTVGNGTQLLMILRDIISPPTLQPADLMDIVIREPLYSSIVMRSSNLYIGGGSSNMLEVLSSSTGTLIAQPITLVINFITRNKFGPNDTITIALADNAQLSPITNAANIVLDSFVLNGYQVEIQDLKTIKISSFSLLVQTNGQLSGTITISTVLASPSTKPITGSQLLFSRNGYNYNTGYFAYSAQQGTLTGNVTLGNNYANSNTTGLWRIRLTTGAVVGDYVFMSIPETIAIDTCTPQCGQQCNCSITAPTTAAPYTTLTIYIGNSIGAGSTLSVSTNLKNPISSNQIVEVCSTDSSNYTKQCGSISYPNITEASLDSETLAVTMSSLQVYAVANYTLVYNLLQYNLQNGFLITTFPAVLVVVDPSNILCTINGQTACRVQSTSPLIINTTISSTIKIYTLAIKNIRNPKTTRQFQIQASIAYTTGAVYYSISSSYLQATIPYALQQGSHFTVATSNCTNSQPTTTTITFILLPFLFTPQIPAGSPLVYVATNLQTGHATELVYNVDGITNRLAPNSSVAYSHTNWYSLEPANYSFVLATSDGLYDILEFQFQLGNCGAASLPLNVAKFTGLPQNAGTLKVSYSDVYGDLIGASNIADYKILVQFPKEYPLSMTAAVEGQIFSISQTAPRTFQLTFQPAVTQFPQPIQFTLSGFTQVLSSSYFSISLYDRQYLMASNAQTIQFSLSLVSNCTFPCKVCTAGDGASTGECMECFSQNLSSTYILDTSSRCVSSCGVGTYLSTAKCVQCPLQCRECSNESYCSACTTNYYLLTSTHSCVTDCPQFYYPLDPQQVCNACVSPCLTCTSASVCLSCVSGHYLMSGQCLLECPSTYTNVNSSLCVKCQSPCRQCSSLTTTCTACADGFFLNSQSQCVQTCTGRLIGYQGVCQACSTQCYLCVDTPSTCYACEGEYKLLGTTCVSSCGNGYFVSTANNSQVHNSSVCLSCPQQCQLCTSASVCSKCTAGYVLHLGFCYGDCPASMFVFEATVNSSVTAVCRQCQTGCVQCINASVCTSCSTSMFLVEGVCLSDCPSGTYASGVLCEQCSPGCLSCLSLTQCLECTPAYTLYLNTCVSQCPTTLVEVNNQCIPCSSYISQCSQCNELQCVSCVSSYYLFSPNATSSQCLLNCPDGYVASTGAGGSICEQCTSGCSRCSVSSVNCTRCQSGYMFYNYACLLGCPSLMISVNGQCVSCTAPCASCLQAPSHCLSCSAGLFLLASSNSCLSMCPNEYYEDTSTQTCQQCQIGCLQCSSYGCTKCYNDYFLNIVQTVNGTISYQCFEQCPAYLPYANNKNCQKCSQYCLQCDLDQLVCLQCEIGYNRYGEYCVDECPSPLVVSNSQCVQPEDAVPDDSQNLSEQQQQVSRINSPLPFTIVVGVGIVCIIISKIQYAYTSVPMSLLSISAFVAAVANIVYIIVLHPFTVQIDEADARLLQHTSTSTITFYQVVLYLLVVALIVTVVTNVLHCVFSFATYRKDSIFAEKYAVSHPVANRVIMVVGVLTSHFCYSLYFCRIFNIAAFKAALDSLSVLFCLNYLWGVAMLANLMALTAGVVAIVKQSDILILVGLDLVIVNSIVLLMALMLLRKTRGSGWLLEDFPTADESEDGFGTKKIILEEGESRENISLDVETLEEVNGRLEKKLIANEVANQYQGEPQKQKDGLEGVYFEDEDGNANSESTDPLKIEPSINIVFTAEEMHPGGDKQDDVYQDPVHSELSPTRDRVLPSQNKLRQSNIFQQDESEEGLVNESLRNSQMKAGRSPQMKSGISSKSLKSSNKPLQSSQLRKSPKNIAAEGLNRSGGTSAKFISSHNLSQPQFDESNNENSSNIIPISNQLGETESLSQNSSGVDALSPDKKDSQNYHGKEDMKIIQEQNQESRVKATKDNQKHKYNERVQNKEEANNQENRLFTATLEQQQECEAPDFDIKEDEAAQSIKLSVIQEQSKPQSREKTSQIKSPSVSYRSNSKSPTRNLQSRQSIPRLQPSRNSTRAQKIAGKRDIQSRESVNRDKTYLKESPRIAPYQFAPHHNTSGSKSKIEGSHTIYVQSDEEKDQRKSNRNENSGDIEEEIEESFHKYPPQIKTIADRQGPFSHSAIPVASKFKTINQPIGKQSLKMPQAHRSVNKNVRSKSFRSKNMSADKLPQIIGRPSTSDHVYEGHASRINAKLLAQEIERKEKIRSQKQSLKNIYLRR